MIRVFESSYFEKDVRRLPQGMQTKLAYLLQLFKQGDDCIVAREARHRN